MKSTATEKTILHIVGARPNFMKAAPVMRAIGNLDGLRQVLVHSGQHYDENMSDIFFRQLALPEPDINLEVGSGSHARQTAQIMSRLEPVLLERRPDLLLVYGDVNSTVAAALVASKLQIAVGHVEAGLRSFDRTMPEEINRLLTDQISDLLFTPSADGDANLQREGVAPEKIFRVGNVMIDTLQRLLPEALKSWPQVRRRLGVSAAGFGLVTLHRPSNVDDPAMLARIMAALGAISRNIPLVFPMHPRTRGRAAGLNPVAGNPHLMIVDPLGYLEFLCLQKHSALLITDSGGIQEETTFMGIPCLTVRDNTERPITVEQGTNVLVGQDMERLTAGTEAVLNKTFKTGTVPELWDGRAGERIAAVIARELR
jgi:UDP-N-acetylglucosamine 2-epimerase (non-hydrolysing)